MVIRSLSPILINSKRVVKRRTRRTRTMNLPPEATPAVANGTEIPNQSSAAPEGQAQPNVSWTGSDTNGQSVKAPVWMKLKPRKPPQEEQKPPKLSEKMKHLSPLFESQPPELQWNMYRNTKNMLELKEKILRKSESLARSQDDYYYDENDKDPEGKAKKKPFVHTSCWVKSPLSCNETIRTDD